MFSSPHSTKRESGFTLVELLVVVVIIAVLAAIAVPIFLNQKSKAAEASVEASVSTMADAIATGASTGGKILVTSTSVKVTDGSGADITVPVPANLSFRIQVDPDGAGLAYSLLKGVSIVANTPLTGLSTWAVSEVGSTGNNVVMANGAPKPTINAANPIYSDTPLNGASPYEAVFVATGPPTGAPNVSLGGTVNWYPTANTGAPVESWIVSADYNCGGGSMTFPANVTSTSLSNLIEISCFGDTYVTVTPVNSFGAGPDGSDYTYWEG